MKKIIILFLILINWILLLSQVLDWEWAIQAGGINDDISYGISLDDNENVYICGYFSGTATFGSETITSTGIRDIFISKLDTNGSFVWTIQSEGTHNVRAFDIVNDNAGNSYVIGNFSGIATFGSHTIICNGYSDLFIAKADTDGNWLWVANAGSGVWDDAHGIKIDENGNSYITGNFWGTVTFGSHSVTGNGERDIFIAKVDTNGNWLWVNNAGGSALDMGVGIVLDDDRNIYVTGLFSETATFGSHSIISNGDADVFAAKADEEGNWQWAASAGGDSWDNSYEITIDADENCYVTGDFKQTATFGPYSITSDGDGDIYVAKIDSEGNWLWASQAGGIEQDISVGIVIDDNDDILVTGSFKDVATFDDHEIFSNGNYDLFIAKMDADGNWLWVVGNGGNEEDYGRSITVGENGYYYTIGCFDNSLSFGPYTLNSDGGYDIFVVKLSEDTIVEDGMIPHRIKLSNYPNPFNPSTEIRFQIPDYIQNEQTELIIYNLRGQKIKSFVSAQDDGNGYCSVVWNGDDELGNPVSSGIYFYKLKSGDFEQSRKMLLLK